MSVTKAQLEEKNRELRATVVELETKVSKLEKGMQKLAESNSALEDGIKLANASANAANADANELRGRVHVLEAELAQKNALLANAYVAEKAGLKPEEKPAPTPKAPAAKKQPEETGIKKSPEPMRLPFGAVIPVTPAPAPKAPEEKAAPAPAPAPAKAAEPAADSEKDARRAKLSPRFRALLEEQEKKPPVQCPISDEQFLQAAMPAPAPVFQDIPDPKLPSFLQPTEGEENEEDDGEIGYPSDDDLEDEISEENGAPYGISPSGEYLDPDEAQ